MPDDSFKVLNSKGSFLIEFYMPGCPPCKKLGPKLKRFAEREGIEVVKVNLNEKRFDAIADRHGVSETPTVIAVKNGKEVARRRAPTTQKELKALANKVKL